MKTAVAETSIQVFHAIEAEGVLGKQEKRILTALHGDWRPGKDWTLREIERLTGISINAVSGRVNKLKTVRPRYLEECKPRRCSITGRTVTPVTLRLPDLQGRLFQ
jgi:hypothetical protein